MIYYAKENKLFCSEVAVADNSFVPITEEEYEEMKKQILNL